MTADAPKSQASCAVSAAKSTSTAMSATLAAGAAALNTRTGPIENHALPRNRSRRTGRSPPRTTSGR
jgi:hypothetical protein